MKKFASALPSENPRFPLENGGSSPCPLPNKKSKSFDLDFLGHHYKIDAYRTFFKIEPGFEYTFPLVKPGFANHRCLPGLQNHACKRTYVPAVLYFTPQEKGISQHSEKLKTLCTLRL